MNRRAIGFLSVIAGAGPAGALIAQEGVVTPGTDVSLAVFPDEDIRGRFLSWDADTLRIQDGASGSVRAVPSQAVERLRVAEPRPRGRGTLRGLLIGSVVGALSFGALFASQETHCFMCFDSRGQAFLYGLAFGGASGGGVGAAVGAAWPGTRWEDVSPPHARGRDTFSRNSLTSTGREP